MATNLSIALSQKIAKATRLSPPKTVHVNQKLIGSPSKAFLLNAGEGN